MQLRSSQMLAVQDLRPGLHKASSMSSGLLLRGLVMHKERKIKYFKITQSMTQPAFTSVYQSLKILDVI
jgi:hypothetical protein